MNSLAHRIVDNLLSRKPTQECTPSNGGKAGLAPRRFPFRRGSGSREAEGSKAGEGSASREAEGSKANE